PDRAGRVYEPNKLIRQPIVDQRRLRRRFPVRAAGHGFSLRHHVVPSRVDHDSESSHVTYTADLTRPSLFVLAAGGIAVAVASWEVPGAGRRMSGASSRSPLVHREWRDGQPSGVAAR